MSCRVVNGIYPLNKAQLSNIYICKKKKSLNESILLTRKIMDKKH